MEERVLFHHIGKDRHFKVWHTLDTGMILYTYTEGGSIVCSEGSYPIHEGTLCFVGAGRYHYTMPDAPVVFKILGVVLPLVFGGYAIWAAKERIEEIQGGEEDDLSQY